MIVHARPPRNDKSIHQKGRPFNGSFSLWLSKLLFGLVFAPQQWHRFGDAVEPRCHGQLRRVCSYQLQGCSPKMLGSWHDIAIEHVSACLIIQGCTRYRAYQIIIDDRCSSWGSRNCWLVDFVVLCCCLRFPVMSFLRVRCLQLWQLRMLQTKRPKIKL